MSDLCWDEYMLTGPGYGSPYLQFLAEIERSNTIPLFLLFLLEEVWIDRSVAFRGYAGGDLLSIGFLQDDGRSFAVAGSCLLQWDTACSVRCITVSAFWWLCVAVGFGFGFRLF